MSQSSAPDLTIIVPVYNAMAHLDGLVADILQIPDVRTEVIFVDDGSTAGLAYRSGPQTCSRHGLP